MKKIIFPLGIISVMIYIVTVLVAGILKPGYSNVWNTVSILIARGETARPFIVTSFTLAYSLLFVIAAYSFTISRTKISKAASILLSFSTIISLIQLFLPMDQWQGVRTAADEVHDWLTVGIAISIIITIFIFALISTGVFRKISFLASGLVTFFSVLSGWFLLTWNFHLLGLFERLWILSFLIWIICFSNYLGKLSPQIDS